MVALRVLAALAGAASAIAILVSALHTVVVPRAKPVRLSRAVFLTVRRLFELRARPRHTYEERDHIMALYAPVSLLLLPGVWASGVILSYTALLWGMGVESWRYAFVLSADSLTTLGTFPAPDMPTTVATTIEAMIGLGLIALVISYLPSIYGAFQRRELAVAMLETRAGDPPSPVELIQRAHRIGQMGELEDVWDQWLGWFADLEETHTSQAALPFFRSPTPSRSWVTAAGCVLDAAALVTSVVDQPKSPRAQLCIRSGYLALRRIGDFFQVPYDPDPDPDDPISIDRSEFDRVCERMASSGVPLVADRDAAWREFAGWRVNYDPVLLGLAGLVMAPWAEWSSDRSLPFHRPPVSLRGRRRRQLVAAPPAQASAWRRR